MGCTYSILLQMEGILHATESVHPTGSFLGRVLKPLTLKLRVSDRFPMTPLSSGEKSPASPADCWSADEKSQHPAYVKSGRLESPEFREVLGRSHRDLSLPRLRMDPSPATQTQGVRSDVIAINLILALLAVAALATIAGIGFLAGGGRPEQRRAILQEPPSEEGERKAA